MGKKKGGKGKKDDSASLEGGELTDAQKALRFELEAKALQFELAEARKVSGKAMAEKKEAEEEKNKAIDEFDGEKQLTYAVTTNMTRQYKAMQEQLLNKIDALNETIFQLRNEVEISKQELIESDKEKNRIVVMKDNEIQQMKIKMDQMAREFGDMLKETLDKMSERIEITSSGWDGEGNGIPLTKKMEEFHLNA